MSVTSYSVQEYSRESMYMRSIEPKKTPPSAEDLYTIKKAYAPVTEK
jgi:hypothetical protein